MEFKVIFQRCNTGKRLSWWYSFCLFVCYMIPVEARTYYVDAHLGDDNNAGLSSKYAWKSLERVNAQVFQPGDSILFHSAQEWFGMLHPKGSGTEGHPIVISKYGGIDKPKIHGGNVFLETDGYRAYQTVYLRNQQYWEISHLEITNMPDNVIEDFDDNGMYRRRGIYIAATDVGELKSITIRNNYIHHVYGDDHKDFHGSAGIMLAVTGKERPSFFNGVQICDNRIYQVNRTGIVVSSYWQRRSPIGQYPDSWMDHMGEYCANLNIVIRGNDLESIGGDGIVPQVSFKTLIEYNKVNGAASRSEGYNAGLWAWNSDSVLIQYNEVWNTASSRDGMAFDCDAYSHAHIYQYNFSHDNRGGFILFFGHAETVPDAHNVGHIIRNNISMNDSTVLMQFHGSGQTDSHIHNNLFFNDQWPIPIITVEGYPTDLMISKNIFQMNDMSEWKNTGNIGNFSFSKNIILPTVKGKHAMRRKNTYRVPKIRDVNEIFSVVLTPSDRPITQDAIDQLWSLLLQTGN